jgi:hypothetical protein
MIFFSVPLGTQNQCHCRLSRIPGTRFSSRWAGMSGVRTLRQLATAPRRRCTKIDQCVFPTGRMSAITCTPRWVALRRPAAFAPIIGWPSMSSALTALIARSRRSARRLLFGVCCGLFCWGLGTAAGLIFSAQIQALYGIRRQWPLCYCIHTTQSAKICIGDVLRG